MYDLIYTDDDVDDLEIARHAFEQIGWAHRVLQFSSGKKAIRYLEELTDPLNGPHLLLLDYRMGGMTAEDFLVHLQRDPRYRDLQVVVLSTVIPRSHQNRLRQLGAKCCVSKPTSPGGYTALVTCLKQIAGELAAGLEPSFDLLGDEESRLPTL